MERTKPAEETNEYYSEKMKDLQYRRKSARRRQIARRKRKFYVLISLVMVTFFGIGYAVSHAMGNIETAEVTSSGKSSSQVQATTYVEPSSDYERVINRSYPIEPGYIAGTGELRTIANSGGKQMETNAAINLEKMIADLNDAGMSIIVQSTYRTDADQEYLYNRQIGRQGGDELKAATISAVPLTSEHQAGLAVDLSIDGNLDESFAETAQGQWLLEHCVEYGYIHRYTEDKMEITGIIWEPWHFRYVGSPEVAKAITDSGKCMEEYYGKFLDSEDIEPYLPYLK